MKDILTNTFKYITEFHKKNCYNNTLLISLLMIYLHHKKTYYN